MSTKGCCALVWGMLGMLLGTCLAGEKAQGPSSVLLPVPNDPTVSIRLWFQVGSQNDPPGKEGLARLTAAMLAQGSTQRHDYEEILELLFPMAAEYAASSGVEMTVIHGRVHRDNLAEYVPLLMDAVCRPALKQQDLDRLRSEVLNYLENTLRYASDEELGKAVLYNEIFAGTPYGHLPAGTIEAVRSITLDDIREFYRKHYTRDNVVIGLGGRFDLSLLEQIRLELGALPAGRPEPVPPPKPAPIRGLRVTLVEKPAHATAISMGYPIDVVRGQADWYPLALANSWFGEHRSSSSHLYQVIREARGLNYGDYSYIEHFPNGGRLQLPPQNVCRRQQIFEIWLRPVPNEARHFALRAALRELALLVDGGMQPEAFELTRSFLGKYILHYAPTTTARLGYALDDRFYGLQGSHLKCFSQRLETMTLEEVNRAIRRHLQYGNMQIVMVTPDAATLKEALVRDAPSPITYPTPKPDAVLQEDRQISTFPLGIRPENVKIVPVSELFVR